MPSRATSFESVLSAATSAVRKAFESTMFGIGCFTELDVRATMRPHFRARIPGSTASTRSSMPRNVERYAASQSAGVTSA